jgi:hypothetical protein
VPEGVEANGETVSAPVMEIVKEWHASDRIAAGTEQPKPKASSNGLTSYQQTLYDAFIEALAEHGQAAPASFGLPARTKVVHKRHLIAEAKARGFYCDEKGEHKNFRSRLNETIATLGRKGLVRSRGIGTDYYLWLVK